MTEASELGKRRDVILVGGSQGAIPALKVLLSGLPANLGAAIGVTVHRGATGHGGLADLLAKHSSLPVMEAAHGKLFRPGWVHLAPSDNHLVLRGAGTWLDHGPKQNHVRPAIDAMFVSGSKAYGARVIGVLLTGNLSDGVAGLISIKQRGGLSLAQDPNEAEAPSMPRNAIQYDDVDVVFSLASLAGILSALVKGAGLDARELGPRGRSAAAHDDTSTSRIPRTGSSTQ